MLDHRIIFIVNYNDKMIYFLNIYNDNSAISI